MAVYGGAAPAGKPPSGSTVPGGKAAAWGGAAPGGKPEPGTDVPGGKAAWCGGGGRGGGGGGEGGYCIAYGGAAPGGVPHSRARHRRLCGVWTNRGVRHAPAHNTRAPLLTCDWCQGYVLMDMVALGMSLLHRLHHRPLHPVYRRGSALRYHLGGRQSVHSVLAIQIDL